MSVLVARPFDKPRLAGPRHSMVALAPARLVMLLMAIAAGIALVLMKLAWFAVVATPASNRSAADALVPLRGDIIDRNGVPLARTIDAWSIGVRPERLINDPHELAGKLAALMPNHDEAWYERRLRSKEPFVFLYRRALPEVVKAVNALGEPGIAYEREPERLYPQSTLAAHALGSLDVDAHGIRGMERVLEDQLTNPLLRATPVALSLDARVQAAVESELGAAMSNFQAQAAAGLVLDVHTGEVIAMVSLPNYDANKLPRVIDPKDPNDAGMRRLWNNATLSVYELGSTFKPITMALAIDSGVVSSMSRRFDARAPIVAGRFRISDDHPQKRYLNIPETLVHSSNIATARIGNELGEARLRAMFTAMGFATRPDIETPERGKPIWPAPWTKASTMTTGYGHGLSVTPLHLASAYAALVNGGTWRPATMMKVAPGKQAAGRRVISEATSARMRQLLRLIVLKGTGEKADAPGYRVGGKTGTAEIGMKGGYSKKRNVSTFAAAFPMDAPRYVLVVMLDSPRGNAQSAGQATAGWTVAPVVSRIIMRTGYMLGVMPDKNRDVDVSELLPLLWEAPGAAKAVPE
ncbi:peptidoglycan D,D-transpeptidase FtsI family protein [Sphingomonas sp.]|uniref:peptidoglycan D,D-transpeptidase FtsI family protein n=1 Tax=Sphingomonas sp. TaxID=28214 RepID=UPI0035A9488D